MLSEEVQDLRRRVLAGQEVSPEEYAQVIESIRKLRSSARPGGGRKKTTKAAKATPQFDLDAFMKPVEGKMG